MGHLDALVESWNKTTEPSVSELLEARCRACRVAHLFPMHVVAGRRRLSSQKQPAAPIATDVDAQSPLAALSKREIEVAVLVARGHSTDSAGRELSLSGNTIRTHKRRIFTKLGIGTSAQLGVLVAKANLV